MATALQPDRREKARARPGLVPFRRDLRSGRGIVGKQLCVLGWLVGVQPDDRTGGRRVVGPGLLQVAQGGFGLRFRGFGQLVHGMEMEKCAPYHAQEIHNF